MRLLKKRLRGKLTAIVLVLCIMFGTMAVGMSATAYDPNNGPASLKIRFWDDQKPDIGFYINSVSKYILQTIPELCFGTSAGEWSAMDILRGMYTGGDYIKYIPSDYFEKYIKVFEQEMIDNNGLLNKNKYTEYSRLILALSALGYDIHNVAPHYRNVEGEVVEFGTQDATPVAYDIGVMYSLKNSVLSKQGINGPIWALIAMNTGDYHFNTREELQEGLDGINKEMERKILAFPAKQTLVKGELEAEGKKINEKTGLITPQGVSTEGKQLEYILSSELISQDGTGGGWALFGTNPDPDITGMALQALAPYYASEEKFNVAKENAYSDSEFEFLYTYNDLKQSVERGVKALSKIQLKNGGFSAFGTPNSESVVLVIVALTELGIDPLSINIELSTIGETCTFIKEGEEYDGVVTNNLIDNLLTFWDADSSSSPDIGGFKHVTAGSDGGGGSGTSVNGMATDQALYGLIAYDRFLKNEKSLYDMRDMLSGEYKLMKSSVYTLTYNMNDIAVNKTISFSPYEAMTISSLADTAEYSFKGWNTTSNGTGTSYEADELLSMPSKDVTLYAIWKLKSDVENTINTIIEKINKIGTVTIESESGIKEVRAAYDLLSETQKEMITNYGTLISAEASLKMIKESEIKDDTVVDEDSKTENPNTKDNNLAVVMNIMFVAVAGFVIVCFKVRKK